MDNVGEGVLEDVNVGEVIVGVLENEGGRVAFDNDSELEVFQNAVLEEGLGNVVVEAGLENVVVEEILENDVVEVLGVEANVDDLEDMKEVEGLYLEIENGYG